LTPSGWTYGENAADGIFGVSVFVLMDKETESLWFPAGEEPCTLPAETIGTNNSDCGLVGINGFYAGHALAGIQTLSITSWAEWKEMFPDTKFVSP